LVPLRCKGSLVIETPSASNPGRHGNPAIPNIRTIRSVGQVSRTPARFSQAHVVRSIQAAKQARAGAIELRPGGILTTTLESVEEPKEGQDESDSMNAKVIHAVAVIIG
jgi:hypothetical protein